MTEVVHYTYETDISNARTITTAEITTRKLDDNSYVTDGFKQMYNLNADRHGTTRFATDREGSMVAETVHGTWREVKDVTKIKVSDTIDADITSAYTGYIYNEVQNLWNAGERVYSAVMKHFTSMDPEPGNVYEKMRVNAYVFAGNNPTTYVDLNGRWFGEDAWNWIKNRQGMHGTGLKTQPVMSGTGPAIRQMQRGMQ